MNHESPYDVPALRCSHCGSPYLRTRTTRLSADRRIRTRYGDCLLCLRTFKVTVEEVPALKAYAPPPAPSRE